jgi:ERCC4-type nuclease
MVAILLQYRHDRVGTLTGRCSAGDHLVGPGTAVERKTVADLHGALAAGRFWRQMKEIRAAAERTPSDSAH